MSEVKLTDDERGALWQSGEVASFNTEPHSNLVAAVESIVAARLQALTAERDELLLATQTTVELETVRWERDSALGDKERAESEWDDWKSAAESYEAERDALQARVNELEAEHGQR